jgi:hypothetical protein
MHADTPPLSPAMVNALLALHAWGHDVADFELADHVPAVEDLLGPCGGVLSITRRSSGTQRLYLQDDPLWLGNLIADVERGHFGKPPVLMARL